MSSNILNKGYLTSLNSENVLFLIDKSDAPSNEEMMDASVKFEDVIEVKDESVKEIVYGFTNK